MKKADPSFSDLDRRFMAHALALARRGLGRVAPNPAVGCVLVRAGVVVGVGWTQPGGRPHAERVALDAAGAAARGATAYVSLEPCSHTGKTPPCADALIAAGVARVVAACVDPDPRVSGRGLARLAEAGIRVDEGLLRAEAEALNAGFLSRIRRGTPLVTVKLATTLDGRIAAAGGESRWITGPRARAEGHRLRAESDLLLTGAGTLRHDDPLLSVRIPGLEDRTPVRAVLAGEGPLPMEARLWAEAGAAPVWLIATKAQAVRHAALAERGVRILAVPGSGRPEIPALLRILGAEGITRVLVEAGSALTGAVFAADAADRLAWFRAPGVLGGDGLAAVAPLAIAAPAEMRRFRPIRHLALDGDVLDVYARD